MGFIADLSRYWSKVDRPSPYACWEWTGSRTRDGYGQIKGDGRKGPVLYAHRVAYELGVRPIPDGLHIDHLCLNTACQNPSHLEAVTSGENTRRAGLNGVAAAHAAATTCKNGHAFDAFAGGQRTCRTCRREANRRYDARRRGVQA